MAVAFRQPLHRPMKTTVLALLVQFSLAASLAQPAQPAPVPAAEKPAKPEAAGDAASQLAAARKELSILRTRHDEKHHLVQRQLRKVAELKKTAAAEVTEKGEPNKSTQLEAAKQQLATLKQRYTDQHPLVQNQIKRVAELERN